MRPDAAGTRRCGNTNTAVNKGGAVDQRPGSRADSCIVVVSALEGFGVLERHRGIRRAAPRDPDELGGYDEPGGPLQR